MPRRVTLLLERPQGDSRAFTAAVSLIRCLPVAAAERALRTRAATLEGAVAGLDAHLHSGLPALLLLEVECERALRAAELDWVRGVLDRLRSGELTWTASLRADLLDDVLE
ncbi:hypothetical protein [Nonomuraea longicatena]|uniref:Uncharacterized protein n=1 Tax=Nonomuraea longicatena TaxID=83682 RepID=A0ABN1PB52_9ACTN